MKKTIAFMFFIGLLLLAATPCQTAVLHLSFDKIVEQADVIFVGTVLDQQCRFGPNGKMIFTDVSFSVERLVYAKIELRDKVNGVVTLAFAGGIMEGKAVTVSDIPRFKTEARYLIFTLMDGKTYDSPVVGSYQGVFPIMTDEVSGTPHPLAYGKRPIVEIETESREFRVWAPIRKIRGGLLEKAVEPEWLRSKYHEVAPRMVGRPEKGKEARVHPREKEMPQRIMDLDEFIREIDKLVRKLERG
jgi:hypothetical protein